MAFDPITSIFNLVTAGLEKWIPDANARQEAAREIAGQVHAQVMGQIEINKAEALSTKLFVAGWRPFIGWVCGSAYAYTFVLQPFFIFVLKASGSAFDPNTLPDLNWTELGMVLFGMLGLGAMRTFEKVKVTNGK
jgi:hypothetical protein